MSRETDLKTVPHTLLKSKRILLKLSGEMLLGESAFGIDQVACLKVAKAIQALRDGGNEIGIVIGGGNIFRGIALQDLGLARSPADQMGMLATIMNGIALEQALEKIGCPTKVLSALECPRVVESYTWKSAIENLSQGKVVVFVGGTGNPFFSTDTAAAMRASEIQAEVFLKATKVDGIYDKDPLKHPSALKYTSLTYEKVLQDNLGVMDATSIALCRSNQIPILVFNMKELFSGKSLTSLLQEFQGTIVS